MSTSSVLFMSLFSRITVASEFPFGDGNPFGAEESLEFTSAKGIGRNDVRRIDAFDTREEKLSDKRQD